ncbi:hypothetical protein ACFCYF_23710 [Streptomyces chartreusis]|uniref:hypothetical protein n=1 Tax=Streptomyces chartreusis TaxID=1969 RepID=UPI0035E0E1BE
MNLTPDRAPAPVVPAHHAQAIAATALKTWPATVGLTIEYLAHHDQGPHGAVTFAVIRTTAPAPEQILLRCDGYGHITRGCEHPTPDSRPCWHPAASHLSLHDPGLCIQHLPPLTVGDWVRHPDQPAYGRITTTDPEHGTVTADFGRGRTTLPEVRVPRVPPHIAAELDHGPLSAPALVLDE